MTWVLIAGLGWTVVGSGVAVVISRVIRRANEESAPAPRSDDVRRPLVLVGAPRGPRSNHDPAHPGIPRPAGRRSTRTPSR